MTTSNPQSSDELAQEAEIKRIEEAEKNMVDEYTFDEVKHVHLLNGKPLNGVTTVLSVIAKPALIQWSANMAVDYICENIAELITGTKDRQDEILKEAKSAHRKKKENAGDVGTAVHRWIESWIENKDIELPKDEQQKAMAQNFVDWATGNNVKFLASEKNVYSKELWLGGICDFICEMDGKVWIGDIKTANGIYPEHFLQMGAYSLMLESMGLYPNVEGFVVVNLKKDGTSQTKKSYSVRGHQESFLSALNLYRALEALKI